MAVQLLGPSITPAEGEVDVRTYYCTQYNSWLLGLKASGFLVVTNRRVLFHAFGVSAAGRSVIQSEVPIADVSGVSSFKGTVFNLGYFLLGLLISGGVGGLLVAIVAAINAASAYNSYTRQGGGGEWLSVGMPLLGLLCGVGSFFLPKTSIWRIIVTAAGLGATLGTIINATTALSYFSSGRSGLNVFAILVAFALVIYLFWILGIYSRRPTFSLAIGSKGGSSTPINISGAAGFAILNNNAAGRALQAQPVADSELMLKEIGALVLDLQAMGEYGISKWKRS